MKIINKDLLYAKSDKSTQRAIDIGIKKLQERLETFVKYHGDFDVINMDEKLIHDVYMSGGVQFYLFKCRVKTLSLRILYTLDENNNVVIVSHVFKKDSRFEYFDFFENECSKYINNKNQNQFRLES